MKKYFKSLLLLIPLCLVSCGIHYESFYGQNFLDENNVPDLPRLTKESICVHPLIYFLSDENYANTYFESIIRYLSDNKNIEGVFVIDELIDYGMNFQSYSCKPLDLSITLDLYSLGFIYTVFGPTDYDVENNNLLIKKPILVQFMQKDNIGTVTRYDFSYNYSMKISEPIFSKFYIVNEEEII
ncbi:hypothetical protein LJC17_03105 [Acholeplasma sp. OttesenSCG-928-E16]|nr:hypothetical protein [Acholeplasma sp. OttesenSCG-928-E16]